MTIPHFSVISLATSTGALQELHQLPERTSYDDRLGRIQELPKLVVFILYSYFNANILNLLLVNIKYRELLASSLNMGNINTSHF